VVSGVIAESLLFLPVTLNEVEQMFLQLELINIEEQMLILQLLKRRRHKTFAEVVCTTGRGWERVNTGSPIEGPG